VKKSNIPLDNSRYNDYCSYMRSARTKSKTPSTARPDLPARAFVGILHTADLLSRGAEDLLKSSGLSLTMPQYNVLRILRGAGEAGHGCGEIANRLISRDPDMTRLLDRMEAKGWIARSREENDRRIVKTRITEEGLRVLAGLDEPVRDFHARQFRNFSDTKLRQLILLLERVRAQLKDEVAAD
jgi:DNA-binding MarR family transcriptional regulator